MACLHLLHEYLDCAIYVDTGKAYPETTAMIEYAKTLVQVITVQSDREGQNNREGLPSEVVPVNWTREGQILTGAKPIMIQNYLACCFENIGLPLFQKAKELGATVMVYGQRNEDKYKSAARDGDEIEGIIRCHPIEHWSSEDVLAYLETQMKVPAHYRINHSSLDCYDCTAYRGSTKDRIEYTKEFHPEFHEEYVARMELVKQALSDSGYMENGHA